ncbi:MAG: alpha/beta hydrolase [Candidatus Dormibacteraeota bacterium]|nr:alpha/beta hydrolase [Candidatus Dormibacteraeota bacterium]
MSDETFHSSGATDSDRVARSALLFVAALFILGAAAVYAWGVAASDGQAYPNVGRLFLAAASVEAVAVVALMVWPRRPVLVLATALQLLWAGLWALSRTVGLPLGPAPWRAWNVGMADLICTALELAAAVALIALIRWRRAQGRGRRARWGRLVVPPALLLVLVLVPYAKLTAAIDVPSPQLASVPLAAGEMATFTYCTAGHTQLAMDLYEPPAGAARPAPVLLQIYGGAGLYGDRKVEFLPGLVSDLNRSGFAVASIDYRLAPLHSLADQVADANCAVRFLRANALRLGVDPARIGAYGGSQGGFLASALGTGVPVQGQGADRGQYAGASGRVQAVVDGYGPIDFRTLAQDGPSWVGNLGFVLRVGGGQRSQSPADYVASGDPPFLILHGTADSVIPFSQSEEMAQRLRAAGVPVRLVTVQGGPHGLGGAGESPSQSQLASVVTRFFVAALAVGKNGSA